MITSTTLRRAIRLTICLAILSNAHFAHADLSCSPGDMGCAIFTGQRAAVAHLRDDNQSLPEWTTRCVNCHTRTDPSPGFAPPLTRGYLLDARSRRGGPPSRYDPVAFCRAIKDGIDPASVVLRKSMPHFELSSAECAALWRFVTNP
ncbi:hypothetical protein BWU74_01310 [Paraburkholderia caledonica]|nr:hypothetical protein BWU74_01310 [Burkholderia sp. Bk]